MVGPEGDTDRAILARRILTGKSKFTLEELEAAAFDTQVLEAENYIPQIVADWKRLREEDPARAKRLDEPIALLTSWDRKSSIESEGMTLFMFWAEKAFGRMFAKDPDPLVKIRSLEDAIKDLERDYGTWHVVWGDVARLQRPDAGGEKPFSDSQPSVPIAGTKSWVGIIFNFTYRREAGQKRRYGFAGDSYVSVIDFGPTVEADSVMVFGQSGKPQSPHYFDQAPLYATGRFKHAWFILDEIKSHAERSYSVGERL
jgi:acyl-homoserine-lactone acylase